MYKTKIPLLLYPLLINTFYKNHSLFVVQPLPEHIEIHMFNINHALATNIALVAKNDGSFFIIFFPVFHMRVH